ncbi:hypothetical protein [Catenovulum maritimum]|uniref:Orphan protein n=1 Tax=Catenovulum maritimum TaxID=1513271 RepID=A0A0J8GUB9_9ALTE|nr:hypothetical protein [Catenovulum maritimum]KMT66370.1 hypothetical protein XM47_03830 [Catenovulum maritimum]
MKESISIQEFLVSPNDLADWHVDSELAADNYNQAIHCIYQLVDEDVDGDVLLGLLEQVWQALAADEYLTEFEDENEIIFWAEQYIETQSEA